jgi:hypothetical protein
VKFLTLDLFNADRCSFVGVEARIDARSSKLEAGKTDVRDSRVEVRKTWEPGFGIRDSGKTEKAKFKSIYEPSSSKSARMIPSCHSSESWNPAAENESHIPTGQRWRGSIY